MRYGAFRIACIYIFISLVWITFSDRLLFYFINHLGTRDFLLLSSCKGYLFVLATGLFLYFIIKSDDKKLKNSELQYRYMYEANPNPMWIYEQGSLKIVSVNNAAIEAYGYSEEEFLSKTILDIRPADDVDKLIEYTKKIGTDLTQSGTWRHVKKDGAVIHVNITSHKINFNDRPNVLIMANDITQNVLFEQAMEKMNQKLEQEKSKLRETQLISKVGGWEYYPTNNKLIWSDEVYRITGISRDDSREAFEIYLAHIHPKDRECMIKGLQDLINKGKQLDITHRIVGLDGQTRYIRQLARLEADRDAPLKIIGSMQDITELKQLEGERNKYFSSLENTLNSISDAFFALDYNMNIIRFNEVFRTLINKDDNIIGESIFKLFPKKQNAFYPSYQKALTERIIVKKEEYSQILKKWIRLAAYPTDDGVAVYFSDITENKLKDIKLKEAIETYELVSQATKDVIYDLDMVNNKISYNTSLTQLVKIPIDQVEYNLEWWRSLIHKDDIKEVAESQEKVSREGKTNWECEYRLNCGNGEYKYIMDQGYFVFNEDKKPVRLIGAIKDIDALIRSNQERREKEEEIKKQNEFLREVAWMSSHEIRRPVATMLGLMNLINLAENDKEKEEIYPLLSKCVNEMDAIVHEIHQRINKAVKL